MNNIFDCSLFNSGDISSDAQLQQAVEYQCSRIGFKGLSNVKITWSAAKPFSEGRGQMYNYMERFDLHGAHLRKTAYRNAHYNMLMDYITEKSSYESFYSRLKQVVNLLVENGDAVNRVAYKVYA